MTWKTAISLMILWFLRVTMSSTFHGYLRLLLVCAVAIALIPLFSYKQRGKD
jgi:hypothetical protein